MPMIQTALWPLQVAVYQRLSNDSELNTIITGVYDSVSESAVHPYVTTGEPTVDSLNVKKKHIENIPWVLHCWSQYSGKKEIYDILNAMLKALTKEAWQIEGYRVYNFQIDPNMQVLEDIGGQTYHGILRVRWHIEKL